MSYLLVPLAELGLGLDSNTIEVPGIKPAENDTCLLEIPHNCIIDQPTAFLFLPDDESRI
jgi:hypothetical protein